MNYPDQMSLISGQGMSSAAQGNAFSQREDQDLTARLQTPIYVIYRVLILHTNCLHFFFFNHTEFLAKSFYRTHHQPMYQYLFIIFIRHICVILY